MESATISSIITASASANRASAANINIAAKPVMISTLKTGIEEHNLKFEGHFKKFDSSKNWYLSTIKCVDDQQFLFGVQCNHEHPARSFIMDLEAYKVFTHAELNEIVECKEQKRPQTSKGFERFLNKFKMRQTNIAIKLCGKHYLKNAEQLPHALKDMLDCLLTRLFGQA
ncbi:hypothetical protein BD408DRAFT_402012 [Parasitella parasitica]|nr:hypothetical protein BD408DRAFT_402012 [Parasitella parasitica]